MPPTLLTVGDSRIELLTSADAFIGLGKAWVGDTLVRSGRLPIRPYTQSFTGHEVTHLKFLGVETSKSKTRIKIEATFSPLPVKLMRDHSFDPIHELADWDKPAVSDVARIDIVLAPATDSFGGHDFKGFSYHYEIKTGHTPLFYLMDYASWELDGDIAGATIVSQSSCSDPLVTIAKDTAFTTEGTIYSVPELYNKCMTHNLPRWASHQAFDYQYKGATTLVGVYDHVDLIRTTLQREPGKAELKTVDKHIFDNTLAYSTSPKKIMVAHSAKTVVAQQNLWTWMHDETSDRARAEFGMKEVACTPRINQNYWIKFTIDTYFRDLLPAAINLGFKEIFVDNLNKSDMTEEYGRANGGNMCSGHEYETAPFLGGPERLKLLVDRCKKHGIRVMSWTNNDQSRCSNIHRDHVKYKDWFVRMEDTRIRYGGAYTDGFAILDFKKAEPRQYWVDCLKKIKEQSGLDGYLFDSFYNLGFMPVNYHDGKCTTQWREICKAFKELQDNGIEFLIESFGPWGQPQHGCPRSYSIDRAWVVYKVNLGNDYTTIPTGKTHEDPRANEAAAMYYCLGHMVAIAAPLFKGDKRLDEIWGDAHKQALADYHAAFPHMKKRYLQEDGKSVLWHNAAKTRGTLFNFADRQVALPGKVTDLSTGKALPAAKKYKLLAYHTYTITGTKLPSEI